MVFTGCTPSDVNEENASTNGNNTEEDYITAVASPMSSVQLNDTHVFYAPIKGSSEGQVISLVSGEVSKVFVENNDTVQVGTPLFEIKATAINRQIEQAKKSVALAQSSYDSAQSRYKDALDTLEKNRALLASGAITESQFDQIEAQTSPAQRDASRIQLEQAQLQLKQLRDGLDDYLVDAKYAGKLNTFTLKQGDIVQQGMALGRIINTQSYQIDVAVAEELYTRLTYDTPVTVFVESTQQRYKAQISDIGSAPSSTGKLFPIKVALNLEKSQIDAGTRINGLVAKTSFELGQVVPVLAVKSDILLKDSDGAFVYKLDGVSGVDLSNATPIRQNVETGFDNGEWIEIVSGLTAEDWIVVKGQHYITKDRAVRLITEEE